jgi:hypothetical protein
MGLICAVTVIVAGGTGAVPTAVTVNVNVILSTVERLLPAMVQVSPVAAFAEVKLRDAGGVRLNVLEFVDVTLILWPVARPDTNRVIWSAPPVNPVAEALPGLPVGRQAEAYPSVSLTVVVEVWMVPFVKTVATGAGAVGVAKGAFKALMSVAGAVGAK